MTTPTDFRAALAELIDAVDRLLGQGESPANPGQRLILTVHVEDLGEIANRARTLLAAPEAVGVSDEQLLQTAMDTRLYRFQATAGDPIQYELTEAQIFAFARAVIARYGTAHPAPLPEAQP